MAKCENHATGESLIEMRTRLREKMNAALQEKLQWILSWQAGENCNSLISRWKLGEQVIEVVKDMEENSGRRYGLNALGMLEKFMHEDKSILNDARRFYRAYTDKKRVQEICDMVMQDGCTHLSYSHMRQLISIKDEQKRHEAMNLALENCWTSAQLGQHVQKVNGGKRSNSPNGRAGVPKSADAVIAQQIAFADDFDNRNARVWADKKSSITGQIDKMAVDDYTEDLCKKLGEVAKRYRQLADAATARAEEAERNYQKVLDVLQKGADNVKGAEELIKNLKLTAEEDDAAFERLPDNPRTRTTGRRAKAAA